MREASDGGSAAREAPMSGVLKEREPGNHRGPIASILSAGFNELCRAANDIQLEINNGLRSIVDGRCDWLAWGASTNRRRLWSRERPSSAG